MARYQVILAYDGSLFLGYQRQARGAAGAGKSRTVQSVVEEALRRIGWQGRSILAAGRTDTGVHAAGQVIAFDLDWDHPPEALQAALNANLPADVAVRAVKAVEPGFQPRFAAVARRYRYRLFCDPVRDPLKERYAWRVWPPVDFALLDRAALLLIGRHDFAAFGTPPRTGGSTIREVFQAGWVLDRGDLVFEILGNAFLYRMVRRLVYVQVAIGQGKLDAEALPGYLEGGPQGIVQGLAPPQGLILVEVLYAQDQAESGLPTSRQSGGENEYLSDESDGPAVPA